MKKISQTIPYKDIDNVSIIRSKYSISSSWFESGLQKRSWMKCLKKIENYCLNPRIGGRIMTIMWKFALLASIKDPQVSYSFARGPKLQQWRLSDAWTIFVGLSPIQESCNVFFIALNKKNLVIFILTYIR